MRRTNTLIDNKSKESYYRATVPLPVAKLLHWKCNWKSSLDSQAWYRWFLRWLIWIPFLPLTWTLSGPIGTSKFAFWEGTENKFWIPLKLMTLKMTFGTLRTKQRTWRKWRCQSRGTHSERWSSTTKSTSSEAKSQKPRKLIQWWKLI